MDNDLKYQVVRYNTPVLREQAEPVTEFGEDLAQLGRDMVETMHASKGIGLAAQQIGLTIAICVVDLPARMDVDEDEERLNPDIDMPMVLVNPEITGFTKETDVYEEGCLSFPGINGRVTRPVGVTIRYQDPLGNEHTIQPDGLLARCIQHEMDHLNGVLFIDHMSPVKRMALKGKLKKLKAATAAKPLENCD